jgi:hypothetical protein
MLKQIKVIELKNQENQSAWFAVIPSRGFL